MSESPSARPTVNLLAEIYRSRIELFKYHPKQMGALKGMCKKYKGDIENGKLGVKDFQVVVFELETVKVRFF